jgi:hypothetical protein
MMRRVFARPILLSILSFACAGSPQPIYPGPERPIEEVATLRGSTNASILEIDGERVSGFGGSYALLPGTYEVLMRIQIITDAPNMRWNAWSYCFARLEALAGESYVGRVRVRKEVAPGLSEKVEMEAGIADSAGALRAPVQACSGDRPRRTD